MYTIVNLNSTYLHNKSEENSFSDCLLVFGLTNTHGTRDTKSANRKCVFYPMIFLRHGQQKLAHQHGSLFMY